MTDITSNPNPPDIQEVFHRKLFSLLLTLPEEITTLEDAAAWGVARGAGLIMQEVTRDTADLQKNILVSLMTKERPELVDLYPGTSMLMQRLLPYLNKHNMGFDELSQTLIDTENFEEICDEAASGDPEMQKLADDMKKLMQLTRELAENERTDSDSQPEESEFTETY